MDSRWANSIGQEQRALTLYCPQSKLLCNVTCFLFLLWLQVTIILLLIITTYVVLYVIDDDNSVTLDIGRSNKMTYFPGPEEFNKDRSSRVFLDTLLWKGPGTAHWVICQWKSSPNPRMSIPSTEQLNGHEKPPNRSQTYAPPKGLWWLKIGTCHVPLQRLNSGCCNYSPSTPPERSSDWASDGDTLWSGILTEQVKT